MAEHEPISDVLRTRSVLIYDDADKLRISLAAYRGVEPKITLYKEDGTPAVEISSIGEDSESRRITLFGKGHHWRLQITCNDNGACINMFDKEGNLIKDLELL